MAVLARHVGPLAGTMVRRTARECADLPALQARLAEQISQVSVRNAFLSQLRSSESAARPGRAVEPDILLPTARLAATRAIAPTLQATPSGTAEAVVSDAWLELAQRALATQLGPIARVVLKRASERTRQRAPLTALLVEAAPESGRSRLRAELDKLS